MTVLLLRRSMLTEKIARRGQHITREYGVDPYELTRVGDVMVRSVDTLSIDLSLADAVLALDAGPHRIYPAVDSAGRPAGLVSQADGLRWKLEALQAETGAGGTVGERLSVPSLPVIHPDDVASHAVDVMLATGQGRLPVTDPATGVLVGLVTRKDLLQVRAAVTRAESERLAILRRRRRV